MHGGDAAVTASEFMESFSGLVLELVNSYGGTRRAFAHAIGVSPSTVSHFLGGRDSHPPSTEVCLRIALVCRVSPQKVLRAAGRDKIADLIEELYGAAAERRDLFQTASLTPSDRAHIQEWKQLDHGTRRALQTVITGSLHAQASGRKRVR